MVLETFGLRVRFDRDLDSGDFETFQMQPGAGDIKCRYPPAIGFDGRAVENRGFPGVGPIMDVPAGFAAFVEEINTGIDAFASRDLVGGDAIDTAADIDRIARANLILRLLQGGQRFVQRAGVFIVAIDRDIDDCR